LKDAERRRSFDLARTAAAERGLGELGRDTRLRERHRRFPRGKAFEQVRLRSVKSIVSGQQDTAPAIRRPRVRAAEIASSASNTTRGFVLS
jgi:hypothetical protein